MVHPAWQTGIAILAGGRRLAAQSSKPPIYIYRVYIHACRIRGEFYRRFIAAAYDTFDKFREVRDRCLSTDRYSPTDRSNFDY